MNETRMLRLLAFCMLAAALIAGAAHAHGDQAHGGHEPQHGGVVMTFRDLHYEVALPPAGGVQVWFTDAAGKELPASMASDVSVEIERADGRIEPVNMRIGDSGECWVGESAPVNGPEEIVRVAFFYNAAAAMVDLRYGQFWPVDAGSGVVDVR